MLVIRRDHWRLAGCTAHRPVTGEIVAEFLAVIDTHGTLASTLTDNASIYTSRFTGGRNAPLRELQQQLTAFSEHYNEHRPHRSLDRATPGQAYRQTPKAMPAGPDAQGHYRLRYDRLDAKGKMSLRRAGQMHHLGVGTTHARTRVLAIADDHTVTVIELQTGEVLSTHQIDPNRRYWRKQNKEAGRWPSSQKRDL